MFAKCPCLWYLWFLPFPCHNCDTLCTGVNFLVLSVKVVISFALGDHITFPGSILNVLVQISTWLFTTKFWYLSIVTYLNQQLLSYWLDAPTPPRRIWESDASICSHWNPLDVILMEKKTYLVRSSQNITYYFILSFQKFPSNLSLTQLSDISIALLLAWVPYYLNSPDSGHSQDPPTANLEFHHSVNFI